MKTKRFFLAHPKSLSDAEIDALRQRTQTALETLAAGKAAIQLTLGRDDFAARWSFAGSWEAWAREVATATLGVHSDEPRYHAIVIADVRLGNATRLIVQFAMGVRKPVLHLHDDGTFTVVQRVVQVNPEDWKAGWEVR